MIIECDSCSTRFRLDESRITGRGVKVRCTKCQSVFIVHAPDAPEVSQETTGETAGETSQETSSETPPESSTESAPETTSDTQADTQKEERESTEERPSIGGLEFNLDSDDDESIGTNLNKEENDFLLDGLNKALQGEETELSIGDNRVDLSHPEFDLPDDGPKKTDLNEEFILSDTPSAGPSEQEDSEETSGETSGETSEEEDDLTFEIDTDGPEPRATAPELPGEEKPNDSAVEFEVGDQLQSAFEDALKEAEAAENATEATAESSALTVESSTESETDTATESPAPETDNNADAEMRQFLSTALETANKHMTNGQAAAAQEPVAGKAPVPYDAKSPAWASSAASSKEADTGTETDSGPESSSEADTVPDKKVTVPPYEIDKRGSKAPLFLAILLIVAIGLALHFTGISKKVLNSRSGPGGELSVAVTAMKGYVAENKEIGALFVVEAKLLNMTDKPQKVKAIRGTLYNRSGKKLSVREVSPGRVVSGEQLRNMGRKDLLKNFKDVSGGTIPPKGTVPVMLLFTNAPEATAEFSLDVLR
jgi:predicted Zn finger-like uncharacterized protein